MVLLSCGWHTTYLEDQSYANSALSLVALEGSLPTSTAELPQENSYRITALTQMIIGGVFLFMHVFDVVCPVGSRCRKLVFYMRRGDDVREMDSYRETYSRMLVDDEDVFAEKPPRVMRFGFLRSA